MTKIFSNDFLVTFAAMGKSNSPKAKKENIACNKIA
jgi:hypothetical protein